MPTGLRIAGFVLAASLACAVCPASLRAQEPIRIGILHSQTGTMALSEGPLKDALLMLIAEANRNGGLLGRTLEPVVADPASEVPAFARLSRAMLAEKKVAVVFGGWTSSSRKALLPVFEELGGLLFYPAPYEGQESSRNVFYTGAVPNQQALPAIEYLSGPRGGGISRWVLFGGDDVHSRTTNRIVEAFLKARGVPGDDIMVRYAGSSHSDGSETVEEIVHFGTAGRKTAVLSTVSGDAAVHFYKALIRAQVASAEIPVVALSIGEQEVRAMDATQLAGHLAVRSYFQSIREPANEVFVRGWQTYRKDPGAVTSEAMEATLIGFTLWTQAVRQAGTTDVDAVRQAMYGQRMQAPSGFAVAMNTDHHLSKPAMIGAIRADGQFDVLWQTREPVRAETWSRYIADTAGRTADWSYPWLCGDCVTPRERVSAK